MASMRADGDDIRCIPGFGPKKVSSLVKFGYDTLEKLRNATFNELLENPYLGFKSTWNLKRYLSQGIDY